jgi:hypothetical protein
MFFTSSEGAIEEELVHGFFREVKALTTVRCEDGRGILAQTAELDFLQ